MLCEGHNLDSQNFLRVQSDGEKYNQNQVNFLILVEKYLDSYSKLVNIKNLPIGMKILEFYVETLQGPCHGNQNIVAKIKIIEILEELSTTLIYSFPEM